MACRYLGMSNNFPRISLTAKRLPLKPWFVNVNEDGVYVTMRMGFDKSGYFVPSKSTQFKPPRDSVVSYDLLSDGVWWFHYHD